MNTLETQLLLCLLGAASIAILIGSRRGFSFAQVACVFNLAFLVVAPWIQLSDLRFPWGASLTTDEAVQATLMNLVWTACLVAGLRAGHAPRTAGPDRVWEKRGLNLLIAISTATIAVGIGVLGADVFLFRASWRDVSINSNPIALIVRNQVRMIPFACAAIGLLLGAPRNRSHKAMLVMLAIIANSPLAVPRYVSGSIAMALLAFLAHARVSKAYTFRATALAVVLCVFPIVGAYRWTTSFGEVTVEAGASRLEEAYYAGDFDAFTMTAMATRFVDDRGVENGRQLLGPAAFFIPRSFWEDKPIGTGAHIAGAVGLPFSNVSCPPQAEGYVNFGWLGVVGMGLLLGFAGARLESRATTQPDNRAGGTEIRSTFAGVAYLITLGNAFFLLRGDLMSGVAYWVGALIASSTIYILVRPFAVRA